MNQHISQLFRSYGNLRGIGPLGLENKLGSSSISFFDQIISLLIGIFTVIAAVYFAFLLISGAIGVITSSGDRDTYVQYRQRITSGAVGLTIIIAGMLIISFIGYLFGISNILFPGNVLTALRNIIQ